MKSKSMATNSTVDQLFANPMQELTDFVFDKSVVDVFPDMINRSVPGYSTIINMTGLLAERFIVNHSKAYDLGCSLGAGTLAMAQHGAKQAEIIGIDNSADMVERCKQQVAESPFADKVRIFAADITATEIENASMVTLNFTLQFIKPQQRANVIKNIYAGMKPGAILLLSEKIIFNQAFAQSFNESMHHRFKQFNGYRELEISQKRTALENVLEPESLEQHFQRLEQAGFSDFSVWFQCFNFASIIAVK